MDVTINTPKTNSEYLRRIHIVLSYIGKNLHSEIDLELLADISCFSKFHFHRVFAAFVGETPANYLNRLRLEKSAALIISRPDLSLDEVGFRCGFSSQSIFSRNFKKYYGVSPREVSRQGKAALEKSKKSQIESKKSKKSENRTEYVCSEISNDCSQQTKDFSMDIEIKKMPSLRIAGITHYGGYNEKIGIAYSTLIMWANKHNYFSPSTKFIGISYDNPDITPTEKCRYKACITVPDYATTDPEIEIETIPELTCAVLHYKETEDGISAAYTNLYGTYLPENGFVPADYPCYEIHLNDPQKDPEHKFIFDICLPIQKL